MRRLGILFGCAALLSVFSVASQAALIEYTFNNTETATIGSQTIPVEATELNIFSITNNTTEVWTDFHVTTNLSGADGSPWGGFELDSYTGPASSTWEYDPFTDVIGLSEWEGVATLNLLGLDVGIGEVLDFSVGVYCGLIECNDFTIEYFAYPTFEEIPGVGTVGDPAAVPEPPFVMLFTVGLAFLFSFSRRAAANRRAAIS